MHQKVSSQSRLKNTILLMSRRGGKKGNAETTTATTMTTTAANDHHDAEELFVEKKNDDSDDQCDDDFPDRRRHRHRRSHHHHHHHHNRDSKKKKKKKKKKKTRGYVAVFLVSAIWVCASFIVKDLERAGDPLTLTALFNALFVVYWPVELKGALWSGKEKKKRYYAKAWRTVFSLGEERAAFNDTRHRQFGGGRFGSRFGGGIFGNKQLRCYALVPPLFFLAQFFFNKSLQFVSVTVNTALSSVAPALTYVLGICRGLEKPVRDSNGFLKALALVAVGVVLTAVADDETAFRSASDGGSQTNPSSSSSSSSNKDANSYTSSSGSSSSSSNGLFSSSFVSLDTAWGILLIVGSAVCYAGYATEVEIALSAVKVSDGHHDESRTSNSFRNNSGGGVLLDDNDDNNDDNDDDDDEDYYYDDDEDYEEDEEDEVVVEVNEVGEIDVDEERRPSLSSEEEIARRRQIKTDAKKERLLADIKDSKSRQILASVGTFAFVIVLCTMRKSISSMRESGGMIVLKGLIDNALAEYLWCVGVAELGASVASIGLLLQIPLSAVAELLFAREGEEVWTRTSGGIFAMFFGCALIVYGFISAMKFAGSTMGDEDEDDDDDGDGGDEAIAIARAPLL